MIVIKKDKILSVLNHILYVVESVMNAFNETSLTYGFNDILETKVRVNSIKSHILQILK